MASASANPECSGNSRTVGSVGNNAVGTVPQWKKDLIQRRRRQNKVLTSNGASVKLCSAVTGNFGTINAPEDGEGFSEQTEGSSVVAEGDKQNGGDGVATRMENWGDATVVCSENSSIRDEQTTFDGSKCSSSGIVPSSAADWRGSSEKLAMSGAGGSVVGSGNAAVAAPSIGGGAAVGGGDGAGASVDSGVAAVAATVVRNMRLETDATFPCPTSEDAPICNARNDQRSSTIVDRSNVDDYDNPEISRNSGNKTKNSIPKNMDSSDGETMPIGCIYASETTRKSRIDRNVDCKKKCSKDKISVDDCESDSSEELQYGPGIVNRLKSKYLNLTLRETNKNRSGVQRFRRAASLEDLLDCDDEPDEKSGRKYAKRNGDGEAIKTERYRNSNRGVESMKRARSVETLMRYNSPSDDSTRNNRLAVARQEPVNDHIVLIDRSSVKIESRLNDHDSRPKAVNKPKRIKPLLAETERPPPDLVKTTMRIFEGSVKKFKPKGEVAVKVATFKTINDTYKSQVMKKIVPKPPVQPKPFVNGNSRTSGSPKKISQISTAEIIDNPEISEERRNDGVETEIIVQSVSSVVSKFRRIEMSHSPSASPEPLFKVKFSPVASPEPFGNFKIRTSTESLVKSPPVTPTPSPRISSPGATRPTSPKRDSVVRRNSSPVHGSPLSPNRESFRQISVTEETKKFSPRDNNDETTTEITTENSVDDSTILQRRSEFRDIVVDDEKKNIINDDESSTISNEITEQISTVDGAKKISKRALENISKAGTTICFNFGDKNFTEKNYLPGVVVRNGGKMDVEKISTNGVDRTKLTTEFVSVSEISQRCLSPTENLEISVTEKSLRLQKRLEPDNVIETKIIDETTESVKPIGAISSLGLMKTSLTTTIATTTLSNCTTNDVKTIRNQKSDTTPPQKQIGIIRPLVSTKTQVAQQNLSNRELEKNLINRVKNIEQPTKVVVSLKTADEIQPTKKNCGGTGNVGGGGGGGLWDTKPWNQANNTMVFNFSNRKDVPDYIENDGLIIRRKREKSKVGDGGVIVLDATLDASTTDDSDWEISGGPPSPCDVSFTNDNVLINGRSNLSKQPRNHKHRIQFNDGATRTFEYPSEASMLEDEGTSVDGDVVGQQSSSSSSSSPSSSQGSNNKSSSSNSASTMSSALLGGGGLASFTPSKMDLASEGFELGVTRTAAPCSTPMAVEKPKADDDNDEDYAKSVQDAAAWGAEANADLLY